MPTMTWSRIKRTAQQILHLGDSPRRTALAFAIGVFIAFSPLYGLHTISVFLFAWAFRLNVVAVLAGSLVNNPWTVLPILGSTMWVGLTLVPIGDPHTLDSVLQNLVTLIQTATVRNHFNFPILWQQFKPYIFPLQSARWVYPSAEHSRFVHSLGAMHVAGRFARHLYPFLHKTTQDVPSANYIEELLRVTALVHDIGHGPFCHFFDENVLEQFHQTHEKLGQLIIREYLSKVIQGIRRSPSGPFDRGEELDPDHVAHLILKDKTKDSSRMPRWLNFLQPVISGSYTGDNLDYVLRDSYMCGVAVGPVDLTRLIHYTMISDRGFTIHKTGLPALQMFLNTRMYLYSNG